MKIRNALIYAALAALLPLGAAWAQSGAESEIHSTTVSTQVEAPQSDLSAASMGVENGGGTVITRTKGLDTAGLDLRYAGTAVTDGGTGNALALVFTGEFAPTSDFSDYIMVIDASGNHVSGRWQVASNPRVLFFPIARTGKYRVILTPGLQDRDGDVLRQRYHGTVDVK